MIAPHIRGRVFARRQIQGRWVWEYHVTNENTGRTLIFDDACSYERIYRECREAVAIARGAWFFGLRKRDVA